MSYLNLYVCRCKIYFSAWGDKGMNFQKQKLNMGFFKKYLYIVFPLVVISCGNQNKFSPSNFKVPTQTLDASNSSSESNGAANSTSSTALNGTTTSSAALNNGTTTEAPTTAPTNQPSFFTSLFAGSAFADTTPKTMTCASGFYLQGIDQNGQLICQQLPASTPTTALSPKDGGSYQLRPDMSTCRVLNPQTNACSCPTGYSPIAVSEFSNVGNPTGIGFYCDNQNPPPGGCGYYGFICLP